MPIGWTLDVLKEHIEGRILLLERQWENTAAETDKRYAQRWEGTRELFTAALGASDRAVTKAEVAAERRFEAVNGFRSALSDQALTLLPRSEADAKFAAVGDSIATLVAAQAKVALDIQQVAGASVRREDLRTMADQIERLREATAARGGKDASTSQTVSTGLAVLAIIVSMLSVYLSVPHTGGYSSQADVVNSRIAERAANDRAQDAKIDGLSRQIEQLTNQRLTAPAK